MENYLTKREIFDKVKNHLLTQGERSYIRPFPHHMNESCLYRHPEGLMCAVGCLIKDEAYSKKLESQIVRTSVVMSALEKSNINTSDESIMDMLAELQDLHDGKEPRDWSKNLDEFERRFFADATIVPEKALDAD